MGTRVTGGHAHRADADVFDSFKRLRVAVLGDYCLDEYLHIDAALNEPSLETGLVAYQCVRRQTAPGAAGTVAKNLANLGVGKVIAVGYVGDDGRGLELRRGLEHLGIDAGLLMPAADRATPAYTKPWITEGGTVREMSRIDIKNWTPTPPALEQTVLRHLEFLAGQADALMVLDQMTEDGCGVITAAVREAVAAFARAHPEVFVYADSRSRIGLFRDVCVKGNQYEITRGVRPDATEDDARDPAAVRRAAMQLAARNGRPTVVTEGAEGVRVCTETEEIAVRGHALTGQLDVCGAGDAFSAAFVAAFVPSGSWRLAAQIGNAAAAVCCTQLGTSGFITPEMIRERLG